MAREWHEVNRLEYVEKYVYEYADLLGEPTVEDS
jgi:hypothetical protein